MGVQPTHSVGKVQGDIVTGGVNGRPDLSSHF